ncbi:MAG: hypothetical protein ACREDQ_03265 [Limisphaerales bacterium]
MARARGCVRARRVGLAAVRPPAFAAVRRDAIPRVVLPVKPFSREHGVSAGKCNPESVRGYFFTNNASEAV